MSGLWSSILLVSTGATKLMEVHRRIQYNVVVKVVILVTAIVGLALVLVVRVVILAVSSSRLALVIEVVLVV